MDFRSARTVVPHGRTHGPQAARRNCKHRPTARRRGAAGRRSLVFDLSMTATCSRTVCYCINRISMSLCVLLRSAKLTPIGNNTLTIRTFLFSPPLSAQAHACTASFGVFFFYRSTGRPRRTSLPLECHRKATRTRFVSSARHSTSR